MAALRRVNRTTRKRTIPRSTSLSLKRCSNLAEVTFFKLVGSLRGLIFLRTRNTIGTLKRQVNLAIILRRHHYRLSNVGAFAVLSLVRLDNTFLVLTLLLRRVTIVCFLPRVNLTRDLIIKVRGNNFYATSGTITLTRLVLVVARKRTSILTGLPPHLRLVRCSNTVDRTKCAIVRELTINGRFAGLTVESSGPILFRLGQPTNVVRLLLQHKTTVGNTRTRRTNRKVPRLLNTIQTLGVTARLHIASHNHRVLRFIRVLAPDTDLKVAITGQIPARCTNRVRHTLR